MTHKKPPCSATNPRSTSSRGSNARDPGGPVVLPREEPPLDLVRREQRARTRIHRRPASRNSPLGDTRPEERAPRGDMVAVSREAVAGARRARWTQDRGAHSGYREPPASHTAAEGWTGRHLQAGSAVQLEPVDVSTKRRASPRRGSAKPQSCLGLRGCAARSAHRGVPAAGFSGGQAAPECPRRTPSRITRAPGRLSASRAPFRTHPPGSSRRAARRFVRTSYFVSSSALATHPPPIAA